MMSATSARRRKGAGWARIIGRFGSHAAAALVLLFLFQRYWSRAWAPDEIEGFTRATGNIALSFLLASLAITPLIRFSGWRGLIIGRKLLGLYAFGFSAAHFLIFLWLDYGWSPPLLREALLEKRYALVGLAAFLILLLLAATSNQMAIRRLGRRWKQLHRLVYLAAVLAIVHYFWLVKGAYTEPAQYAALLAALFLLRLPHLVKKGSRRPNL